MLRQCVSMTHSSSKTAESKDKENRTVKPLAVPTANDADDPSDWLRLPKPKQRLWGLSRTTWIELMDSGKVKGITLRKKHAQRGIRLIFRPSAEAYLKSLMAGGDGHERVQGGNLHAT